MHNSEYDDLKDRIDLLQRKLSEAERLLTILDQCPQRMVPGMAVVSSLEAQTAATRIHDVPAIAVERAIMAIRYGEFFDDC